MKNLLLTSIIFLSVSIIILFYFGDKKSLYKSDIPAVKIGRSKIIVEIADTPEEQTLGLSGRKNLNDGFGMLFPYDSPSAVTFWMKDMLIPIDIIYIKDNKVIMLYENVQPEPGIPTNQLKRYPSTQAINYVLEVPANWSKKNGIGIGSDFAYSP